MRTLLLVGVAAVAAFASQAAEANHRTSSGETVRTERRVIVVDSASAGDATVYRSSADRELAERDYRGRWEGEWQGTWHAEDGRTYEGRYRGTYDGERGASYDAPQPEMRDYRGEYRGERRERMDHRERYERHERIDRRDWSDADWERHCRRDSGVGGAAIGGVVGGVAGNRIAGRGNRTAGTLIGAGVGAIAGAAIDRAEDRRACESWWSRSSQRDYRGRGDSYYGGGYAYEGGYYSSGGYEYAGMQTIVIPGAPIIIEETETTYETVHVAPARARVAPRRAVRPRAAPRPRPRCVCR
jgi:hypothetical protein